MLILEPIYVKDALYFNAEDSKENLELYKKICTDSGVVSMDEYVNIDHIYELLDVLKQMNLDLLIDLKQDANLELRHVQIDLSNKSYDYLEVTLNNKELPSSIDMTVLIDFSKDIEELIIKCKQAGFNIFIETDE